MAGRFGSGSSDPGRTTHQGCPNGAWGGAPEQRQGLALAMTAAATANLEGFERAYRLRSSADDELLRQIFGEAELAEISKNTPSLIETARAYFPHLTSSTYERLAREPDTLKVEKDRCAREMEQLAVQNYGAFISNAKVTHGVRQELVDVQNTLDEMVKTLEPMQQGIQDFKTKSSDLGVKRAALRNVLQMHGSLLELLELPQLLDACIRNQMYDESLELLSYCGNMLQVHEVREGIPVLASLREQVAVQRANLHASLVAQLKTDIHLPACVRVIGFLRRLQQHSEEDLRRLFIDHRGSFLEVHKQQVEAMRSSRGSVVTALRNAADLLRTHVYDIGTQYKALFPQDDAPLSVWLGEQVLWLTDLLREHLLPPRGDERGLGKQGSAVGSGAGALAASTSGARGPVTGVRIDAAALANVLRQCLHASSTLKRLGGQFFPAVAGIFEARLEHHVCEMLDVALLTFHAELGRYDWVPSTALSSSNGGAAAAGGGASWMHPQALELTRHRPLAIFTNDLVQMFNELRQSALYGLREQIVSHCFECLMAAVNLLKSIQATHGVQQGTPKAAEFARLCTHFARILLPLMASHLEAVYGSVARLDVNAILAAMVPDLLPESETEYPTVNEAEAGAWNACGAPVDEPDACPQEVSADKSVTVAAGEPMLEDAGPTDVEAVAAPASMHGETLLVVPDSEAEATAEGTRPTDDTTG